MTRHSSKEKTREVKLNVKEKVPSHIEVQLLFIIFYLFKMAVTIPVVDLNNANNSIWSW